MAPLPSIFARGIDDMAQAFAALEGQDLSGHIVGNRIGIAVGGVVRGERHAWVRPQPAAPLPGAL